MHINLLAKYYQGSKERLQIKLVKGIKVFLKKKKDKRQQYGCKNYKILPENQKQKLVEYRKKHYKMRKKAHYNYKELFSFRKFGFSLGWG